MLIVVKDKKFLEEVDPRSVGLYLGKLGWILNATSNDNELWSKDNHFKVVLPRNKNGKNYHTDILDVLQTIARSQKVPQINIYCDVTGKSLSFSPSV